VKTSVTDLPDSRARIDVEIDAAEIEAKLKGAAGELGKQMKMPGFRKGKVPAEIVLQRVGREAVFQEALQHALPQWYEGALLDAGVNPIGDPELKLDQMPAEGEALSFSIEVGVRPKAKLGKYKGLEVGRAEPQVPAEVVQEELDRLREAFATLEPVERAAGEGDVVLIDYTGEVDGEPFEGGEARDQMVEVGAGRLLEEFDAALLGATAGEEKEVKLTFPADYGAEAVAGKDATFKVTVKEVREKNLPQLNDEFAAEASEFETLAELRTEIEGKIRHVLEHRTQDDFRQRALDAAAAEAKVDVPEALAQARAAEMWDRFARQIAGQGLDPDAYLKMQGKTRDEMIAQTKPQAEMSIRHEAVVAAVAQAEEIEFSEAIDLIAAEAKPIPLEQAVAREKIWTPEKEAKEEKKAELWTP
jgi:trigger factor